MDAPSSGEAGASQDALLAEAGAAAQSVLRVVPPSGAGALGTSSPSREPSPTLRAAPDGVLRAAFRFDDAPYAPSPDLAGAARPWSSPAAPAVVEDTPPPLAASPAPRRALAPTRAESLDRYAPPTPDDEWLTRRESGGSTGDGACYAACDAAPSTPPTPPRAPAAEASPPQPPAADAAQSPQSPPLPRRAAGASPLFPDGLPSSYFTSDTASASAHASYAAIAAAAAAAVASLGAASPRPPPIAVVVPPEPLLALRPPSVLPALAAAAATRRMETSASASAASASAAWASPRVAVSSSLPGSPSSAASTPHLHAFSAFDTPRRSRFDLLASPRPKPVPKPPAATGGWDASPLPPASPASARRARAGGAGGGMEPPGGRNPARAALSAVRPPSLRRGTGAASPSPRAEDAAAAAAALLRGGRAFDSFATASAPGSALPSPPASPPHESASAGSAGHVRHLSSGGGIDMRRVSSVGAELSEGLSPTRAPRPPGSGAPRSPLHVAAAAPLSAGSATSRAPQRWPESPSAPEGRASESLAQLTDALGAGSGGGHGDAWLAGVASESAAAAARAGLLRLSDCDTSAFTEALRDATAAVHTAATLTDGALSASPPPSGPLPQRLQSPRVAAARTRSLASHAFAAALGALIMALLTPQLGRALAAAWATLLRKVAAAAAA